MVFEPSEFVLAKLPCNYIPECIPILSEIDLVLLQNFMSEIVFNIFKANLAISEAWRSLLRTGNPASKKDLT
jgi:hypothetical protein